jgi:hypothetical protein
MPRHPADGVRKIALAYPDVVEGTVCERTSFKVKKKAFVFMGRGDETYDIMVKLHKSLDEAAALAAQEPESYKVGGHNWVTARYRNDQQPPAGLLERWIDESYRLLVPQQKQASRSRAK